ncbi:MULTISPECIES: hypothetical protein [unclassified Paenibacillus]|uniref:hypothetical protein n=1 Tax=unclassified Paenibacillus TaxID=185978 RepID=UPI0024059508|nr:MULTISPECIES: hypothetical protein [unclassified Paenibacillus]MDF9840165.1 Tfp pilus assembly protein PilX [Paenibacillus sp. PastF-2]MDF9846747.1 Tfp pilus assembly protein PilX [Paenibacillus sp. PastM-2]MDF9852904.1 Tfp pilus assembly protein PilX [Paenibacillus sp. PastF-1]MDH6478591.1 Tfp pilus assembly protein PilX [Paenibacillus sp. PastH-2]MDH6505911.1 Tfp pilus assembly protein PilX [Paenibacillus sp. PastM-3]
MGIRIKKDENGSALVLVMFLVLLLTILGLGVLSATIGGAARSETRENDVQSLHLAQKGLSEATAYIQSQLTGLQLENLDPKQLETILSTLNNNKSSLKVSTELESTSSGAVEGIDFVGKKIDTQSIKYTINVTSSAMVNGVKRKLRQQIVIDSYPDFLKYAFGSEQTLTLNGAPLLQGNIYAGDKLVVTNTPEYIYKKQFYDDHTINDFPTVTMGSDTNALGEVHVQSMDSIEYEENRTAAAHLPQNESERKRVLAQILHITPDKIKIKEQKKFVKINVEESFLDKLSQGLLAGQSETVQKNLRDDLRVAYNSGIPALNSLLNSRTGVIHINGMPTAPVKINRDESTQAQIDQYDAELSQYNSELQKLEELNSTVVFNGNLIVDGLEYKKLFYPQGANGQPDPKSGAVPSWFIVTGNLELNNYNLNDFLNVRANILVTGDVKIKGDIRFDSTMFVLGKTIIEDADIKGIQLNGKTKELVLISKGSVLVNRLNAFAVSEPSASDTMEAFFYTDSSGELYGVGSMFRLKGGFFAKGDLTVNAVVGRVDEPAAGGKLLINQGVDLKRFVIDYKYDIYENQQSSLPRVASVNVHVGPLQLINN